MRPPVARCPNELCRHLPASACTVCPICKEPVNAAEQEPDGVTRKGSAQYGNGSSASAAPILICVPCSQPTFCERNGCQLFNAAVHGTARQASNKSSEGLKPNAHASAAPILDGTVSDEGDYSMVRFNNWRI